MAYSLTRREKKRGSDHLPHAVTSGTAGAWIAHTTMHIIAGTAATVCTVTCAPVALAGAAAGLLLYGVVASKD